MVCFLPFSRSTDGADHPEEPPAGQLRVANPATGEFTASLLASAASMFRSKFFGTGGDEINAKCYSDDQQTQASLQASGQTLEQALDKFTQKNHAALRAQGKSAVVWQG
jgi:hexosaminidase